MEEELSSKKPLTPTQEKMRKKKLTEIKKDLQSSEEVVVLNALKNVKKHGDHTVVEYLVHTMVTSESEAVTAAVIDVFNNLKDNETVEPIIDALKDPKTKGYRQFLIGALWQSGLNINGYINPITETALNEDYITAFECLTVIDSADDPGSHAELEEAIRMVGSFLEENQEKENTPVVKSIYEALQNKLLG